MPNVWYYGRNEERHGPVQLEVLRRLASSRNLDETDLVWSPGMADWVSASEVEGLFSRSPSTMASAPPPPPPPKTGTSVVLDRWHYEREGERQSPVSFAESGDWPPLGIFNPTTSCGRRGCRNGSRRRGRGALLVAYHFSAACAGIAFSSSASVRNATGSPSAA